ncbi:MAG: hypothetical protein AAGA66_20125 [Bacteroidota bacterium]
MNIQRSTDFHRIKLLLVSFEINEEDITHDSDFKLDLNMNEQIQAQFFQRIEYYIGTLLFGFEGVNTIGQLLKRIEHARFIDAQNGRCH